MATGNGSNYRTGENIVIGGLIIQVVVFGFSSSHQLSSIPACCDILHQRSRTNMCHGRSI